MSADPTSPNRAEVEKSEREFVLMPWFRRVRARISRGREGQIDPFGLSPEQLPSDTTIFYPDRYGNYAAAANAPAAVKTTARAEEEQSVVAARSKVEQDPEFFLRASNLSYLAQRAAEVHAEMLGETEPFPVTDAPMIAAEEMADANADAPQRQRKGLRTAVLELLASPKWAAARPALFYGALGFAACLILFVVPGMRRPASTLLPAPTQASRADIVLPTRTVPAAAREIVRVPGNGVTIRVPSSGGVSAARVQAKPSAAAARQYAAEDVVIHHYAKQAPQPRVERTMAGVKRYSDLPQ